MAKRSGLGRNLSMLLGQTEDVIVANKGSDPKITDLSLEQLQPGKYQPRGDFDEAALAELAESIRKQGLLQPLVVRKIASDRFEIIAGERRWRACKMAGMTQAPVIVRQVDDETAMAMALIENLQREDLNALDQARAMQRLTNEFDLTHQQVADLLSKSRATVSNFLRLLQLNDEVTKLLEHGDLEMGHARCLLMLTDKQQSQVAQLVVAKNLSVRETEALVARVKSGGPLTPNQSEKPKIAVHYEEQLQNLSKQLNAKLKLKPGKGGKGSLQIHYEDESVLNSLLETLQRH